MGQCRQFIDEVEADDDADGSDEVEQGAMEFPRDFRVFAAHDDDADEVDQEDGQVPVLDNSTMCMSGTKPEMTAMRMEPKW